MRRDNRLLHGHGRLTPNEARLIIKQVHEGFRPAIRYYKANLERVESLARPKHDRRRVQS